MGGGASKKTKKSTRFTILTNPSPDNSVELRAQCEAENYYVLPRGGYLVETDLGTIQFGIPPETIKDSLAMGLSVPHYFVLPSMERSELFDRRTGLSKAEFEFPIYFNFFVRKRRVKIITNEETEQAIKLAFQETLLGPTWLKEEPYKIRQDFPKDTPEENLPNVFQEGVKLDRSRLTMTAQSMLDFMYFDPTKGVVITPSADNLDVTGKCVTIKPKSKLVDMKLQYHYGVKGAKGKREVQIPISWELGSVNKKVASNEFSASTVKPFDIPAFGCTMLGVSHGFDSAGLTTGFVVWMNRKGVMVDPPPNSSEVLDQMGIPFSSIESVILTHCHADHDAGTFQKILLTRKINFFTTRTIRDSFIRKYAAITGFEADFLNTLYVFHPVTIGVPMDFCGGTFTFRYSLHTIPCIGFIARFGGESLIYSADTYTDPELQFDEGVGTGRQNELRSFDWNHTVVLHEMGVPPIHTPLEQLQKACRENQNSKGFCPLKDRLFILHTKQGDAEKHGLLQAHNNDTIRIDVVVEKETDHIEMIGLLCSLRWLTSTSIPNDRMRDLAANKSCVSRDINGSDTLLHSPDAKLNVVLIVRAGLAMKYLEGEAKPTRLQVGDCIGLEGLLCELREPGSGASHVLGYEVRNSVGSDSHKLTLLEIPYKTIIHFLKGLENGEVALENTKIALEKILEESSDPTVQAIRLCPTLDALLEEQMCKYEFRHLLKKQTYEKGDQMQQTGQKAEFAFVITEGRVMVALDDSLETMGARTFRGVGQTQLDPHEVGKGTFVADINALMKSDKNTNMLIQAESDVECFRIDKEELVRFFEDFPGVLFQLLDAFTVPTIDTEKYSYDPEKGVGHVKRDLQNMNLAPNTIAQCAGGTKCNGPV